MVEIEPVFRTALDSEIWQWPCHEHMGWMGCAVCTICAKMLFWRHLRLIMQVLPGSLVRLAGRLCKAICTLDLQNARMQQCQICLITPRDRKFEKRWWATPVAEAPLVRGDILGTQRQVAETRQLSRIQLRPPSLYSPIKHGRMSPPNWSCTSHRQYLETCECYQGDPASAHVASLTNKDGPRDKHVMLTLSFRGPNRGVHCQNTVASAKLSKISATFVMLTGQQSHSITHAECTEIVMQIHQRRFGGPQVSHIFHMSQRIAAFR